MNVTGLVQLVLNKFKSGNSVPIERIVLRRDELNEIGFFDDYEHVGFMIGGPHAVQTTYNTDLKEVEEQIKALCKENGDDPDDYTATPIHMHFLHREELKHVRGKNGETPAQAGAAADEPSGDPRSEPPTTVVPSA